MGTRRPFTGLPDIAPFPMTFSSTPSWGEFTEKGPISGKPVNGQPARGTPPNSNLIGGPRSTAPAPVPGRKMVSANPLWLNGFLPFPKKTRPRFFPMTRKEAADASF